LVHLIAHVRSDLEDLGVLGLEELAHLVHRPPARLELLCDRIAIEIVERVIEPDLCVGRSSAAGLVAHQSAD
jgi:hypothetical protein